jgi:sodium/proline symporter
VWAGIGCTFSVVILLTLFWKPFHGRAALSAMILGLIFTIVWISSGMDKVVTAKLVNFFFTLIVAVLSTYLIRSKKEKGS